MKFRTPTHLDGLIYGAYLEGLDEPVVLHSRLLHKAEEIRSCDALKEYQCHNDEARPDWGLGDIYSGRIIIIQCIEMSISDQETSEDEGMGINYFWVLKIILKTSDELTMGLVTFTYITK